MENRLKERLTGAAILVALIVLLVPEMFHGQGGEVATKAGSSGEGPPVRSYTIDLSNGPSRTAPLQSTPPPANTSPANDLKAAPAPTPSHAPALPPPSAATLTTPSSAAAAASSSGASPHAPSSGAAAAASKPGPASPAAHSSGGWSVQLGLFASRDNADRLMHSAQAKGFSASVSERDVKGLYHVHMVGLADRAAAQILQQRLHDQGFAAAVVPQAAASPKSQP